MEPISPKALQLILQSEGLNQPGIWPGGASGITIGIGYDLGYTTLDRFESDWNKAIPGPALLRLREVVGLTGLKAKNKAAQLADIKIKRPESEKVFAEKTIPQEQLRTQIAFPGLENLPLDAQGALVSLVYNRGASMIDSPGKDNRKEMRAIKAAVAKGDLKEIAKQLRLMKRLWEGKGLNGLIKRREDEALLVEGSIA